MTTVDTQIENALSRARNAGVVANNYAVSATSGVGGYAAVVPPTTVPPEYTVPLTLSLARFDPGSSGGTASYESVLHQLNASLDAFFASFYTPDQAYLIAQEWVIAAIATGSAPLPAANQADFADIWVKARSNVVALGNTLAGLPLPVEATTAHTPVAYDAFDHAEQYAIAKRDEEMWRFAVSERVRDLRAAAITATGQYISALAHAGMAGTKAQTTINEAKARVASISAEWYTAQVGARRTRAERETITKTAEFNIGANAAEFNQQQVGLFVKAAVEGATAVATVAQAAMAALNSVVSSSTVGFA